MKKILLPTDFSESARKACEYAINLFGDEPVKFVLINSYIIPASTSEMLISISDVLRQNSIENLLTERNFLASQYPEKSKHLEYVSSNGYLDTCLNDLVRQKDVLLIVMGTTGASGLKKFFMGSNAAKVLRNVKCPIITVPHNTQIKTPENISLAVDETFTPSAEVLEPLAEVVRISNANLMPVHIDVSESATASDSSGINDEVLGQEVKNVQSETLLEGLQTFNSDNKIDLLTMVHHKRSFLRGLFDGGNSSEMAMLSAIPLLVLHDK